MFFFFLLVQLLSSNLTWRDMQHIVIASAKQRNLAGEWRTNGVGRNVSHWFGYGLIDASAMVDLAKNWTNVKPQNVCKSRLVSINNKR